MTKESMKTEAMTIPTHPVNTPKPDLKIKFITHPSTPLPSCTSSYGQWCWSPTPETSRNFHVVCFSYAIGCQSYGFNCDFPPPCPLRPHHPSPRTLQWAS